MIYSPTFDAYAKIAMEKGLIKPLKKVAQETEKEKAEKAYNTNAGKSVEEMLEEAHPESVMAGPSYDRFNGLVENLKERQDMMVMQVMKSPRAIQTQHQYVHAHKELLDETIKLGFMLDADDQEELMELADHCSEQMTKTAWFWYAAAGIAALLGVAALIGHSTDNPGTQGLKNDIDAALDEIKEAVDEHNQLGVIVSPFVDLLGNLKTSTMQIDDKIGVINKDLIGLKTKRDAERDQFVKEVVSQLFQSGDAKMIETMVAENKKDLRLVMQSAPDIIEAMTDADKKYPNEHWQVVSDFIGWWEKWVPGAQPEWVDAVKQVQVLQTSCASYQQQLDNTIISLNQLKSLVEKSSNAPLDQKGAPMSEDKDREQKEIEAYLASKK